MSEAARPLLSLSSSVILSREVRITLKAEKMQNQSVLNSALLFTLVTLGGCAMTTAVPITKDKPIRNGFLVNATSTIFVQDAKGLRPVTYADPCKRYAVRFWAIAAKNKSTLTLSESGTLVSIATDLDSTDVPLKALEIGEKLVDKIPEGFNATSNPASGIDSNVRYFDIECRENGKSYLTQAKSFLPSVGSTSSAVAVTGSGDTDADRPDLIK